jgi:hypothetical protein
MSPHSPPSSPPPRCQCDERHLPPRRQLPWLRRPRSTLSLNRSGLSWHAPPGPRARCQTGSVLAQSLPSLSLALRFSPGRWQGEGPLGLCWRQKESCCYTTRLGLVQSWTRLGWLRGLASWLPLAQPILVVPMIPLLAPLMRGGSRCPLLQLLH